MDRACRPPAIAGLLTLAACGGSEGPTIAGGLTVYDSAGVAIIDHGPLPDEATPELMSPEVVIGVTEGAPEYQLFRVSDVKRLSDGAVAVANGGTRELRIYEPDGVHRATAGGPGQGPSEFRYPVAIVVLAGDTIQVQDRLDRVYFSADGAFIRRRTTDAQALVDLAQAAGGMSEGGQWLADGSYFAPVYSTGTTPPPAGPPFRPAMTLVRASSDLATLDTLGRFGGVLQQFVEIGDERPRLSVPPFAPDTRWALGSSDGTIVVGDNGGPELHRFHPDGSRSILRWSAEAEGVTAAEVEAWKDRQRNASWTQRQLPQLERAWANQAIPDAKPFFGVVRTGSDGTMWLGPNDDLEGSTTVTVFDPDGDYRGKARFPGRFTVHDSGPGWVLGILTDENEVEFIHLYRL